MAERFERLLGPGKIGTMKIRNRIVMPPMVRNYTTPDGIATTRLVNEYLKSADGKPRKEM